MKNHYKKPSNAFKLNRYYLEELHRCNVLFKLPVKFFVEYKWTGQKKLEVYETSCFCQWAL